MSTRILLVGVIASSHQRWEKMEALEELAALTRTSGGEVVERLIQVRPQLDPATLIGKGKALEIREICHQYDIQLVIFDDQLSATQLRNLEEIIGVRVIDRTAVILDIFAIHARTAEAKVQVELAQLEYIKTRLTGLGIAMSRLGGGIGTRGPGETKLEVDRRRIEQRITALRRQLKRIDQERAIQRKRRNDVIQLTLAGYTNAGKSSLFNRLTNSQVKVSERMFATLDASTRVLAGHRGVPIVLTDTVGFIRNLPTQLIASFRSTLAEIKYADLIIHVADVSDAMVERRIDVVNETLQSIGVEGKPVILALNKIDRVFDDLRLTRLKALYPDAIFISAVTGAGIDNLLNRITAFIDSQLVVRTFTVPQERWDLVSIILSAGEVVNEVEIDGKRRLKVKGLPAELARLRKQIHAALK
ncbi:MAG: GTPase HflX [candidate division WOR-3 bacterium]|jgi:GTP-binding protein HflX|nr:GTPase HflX [candidate division WOR-3 bacterium]MCR4423265.1 GTPase HflX [candidate division WOR-3 bacterium]MDH7518604.1 GTPase HflX [bacterium]